MNSLSWLSLKRLETNVSLEEQLDLMIRKPQTVKFVGRQHKQMTNHIYSIKRNKAERTFVKKIINNSHWDQLIQDKYRSPLKHVKTELTSDQQLFQTNNKETLIQGTKRKQPMLQSVFLQRKDVPLSKIKQRLLPFLQDVYPLRHPSRKYRSVTTMQKNQKIVLNMKDRYANRSEAEKKNPFKVHEIQWRNRANPVFKEQQLPQVDNN